MEIRTTRIDGPLLLVPRRFGDDRGFIAETYRASALAEAGVDAEFVQDNHSRSVQGVVRAIHFQKAAEGAAKLVRCARGAIFDVVVDLRRGSPTFGEWEGFRLDDEVLHALYVPHGFGHGFCVLSEVADVAYKQTHYYDAAVESEIHYLDPQIGIEWPTGLELQVSARDDAAPSLESVAAELPFTYG